jgi:hypothetical protein
MVAVTGLDNPKDAEQHSAQRGIASNAWKCSLNLGKFTAQCNRKLSRG